MSAERPASAVAEVGQRTISELTSQPISPNGLWSVYDKLRQHRRKLIVASLGFLALGPATQARSDITLSARSDSPNIVIPSVPLPLVRTETGAVSPPKWTGVLEDAAKQPQETVAVARMGLVNELLPTTDNQTSQNIYVKESLWAAPGQYAPDPTDFANLENSIRAARVYGYHICLAVWPYTWGRRQNHAHWEPPTAPHDVVRFTTLLATVDGMLAKDFGGTDPVDCWVVGNEPNNPTFWWPQFDKAGNDIAAPAYEHLLARSYDTIKKFNPRAIVIGGELSSHGNDDPTANHASISPGRFILDMGKAYRDSGRTQPIMDINGFHPYPDNSSESPATPHPNSTTIGVADYPKLVDYLGEAFDGTAQPGSTLPIIYDEFAIQSDTVGPKNYLYHGDKPVSAGAVDYATQAKYAEQYFDLAACQRNVIGAFWFHTEDERDRQDGWQGGPFFADGTPKPSEPAISQDMIQISNGGIPCPQNFSGK